jgi:uncharacterized lipoprotein YmbA
MRFPIAVLVALAILPACLAPRVDASRYFTLPAAGAPSGGTPFASVGLGPVALPSYLSRPEVATRLGPEQIAYSANDRWAGPLEDLAFRALSEELRARLPAREVLRWPWPLGAPPEVGVSVEFLRFEFDAAGGATLQARWTVSVRGRAPVNGETRLRETGAPGDVPGSVAALGRALGALASDLAAAARAPGG